MTPKRLAILFLCGALITPVARANVFNMASGLTSVQFVTVGNPGNAPDTRYNGISVGSVDHVYQIGTYEITAGQYTEFLNAVAKDDPNGLYTSQMGDPANYQSANIKRFGASPNFTYSVASDWANRPVDYVSFWDAARFCNWLHNGQPNAAEGPGTTESGAYHDVGNQTLFGRSPGARYFIPTEDEWYKAAYHDKSAGLAASYFDYPAGSNAVPINTLPDTGNHANYYDFYNMGNSNYSIGGPYLRTNVGEFENSPSPYGTFDQGGNVFEWDEAIFPGSSRGIRGGAFDIFSPTLKASDRDYGTVTNQDPGLGFRIAAAIPEPSTAALLVIGCVVALVARRRG
jgi:formylglycine-generating enzyme